MQPPTCRSIRIRSTHDAHRIIRAVELGILPLTQRRLDIEERKALRSGDVWVWEERGTGTDNTGIGIERWTDGRTYGPSRVRDDFLFYSERDLEPFQPSAPYNPNAQESLVKQTYSVYIHQSNGHTKKWHITAYFSQLRVDELATVEHMPAVARLPVPEGRYTSARSSKHRARDGRPCRSRGSISEYPQQQPHSPKESESRAVYSPRPPPVNGHAHQQQRPSITHVSELKRPITNPVSSTMLVPLAHLQNPHNRLSPPQRYPEDEKLLRSLTFGT